MTAKEFEDGPWAQKFMQGSDKKLAFDAARRAGRTIGEWLGEAIREKVAAEREDITGEVLAPDGSSDGALIRLPHHGEPLSIADIGQAVDVAKKIAELRGKPLAPNSAVLIEAQRALRRRLT
jgi:hypothetical protein